MSLNIFDGAFHVFNRTPWRVHPSWLMRKHALRVFKLLDLQFGEGCWGLVSFIGPNADYPNAADVVVFSYHADDWTPENDHHVYTSLPIYDFEREALR